MAIKCELTMLTFTKTKNTRLPDSVYNAGVTLQSRDIPHTLPSPIFYERAPVGYNDNNFQMNIYWNKVNSNTGII
jgi:hypothetical protein